jgi:hypothetical protein
MARGFRRAVRKGAEREPHGERPGRGVVRHIAARRVRVRRRGNGGSDSAFSFASGEPGAIAVAYSCNNALGAANPDGADRNGEPAPIDVRRANVCASPATVAGSARPRCACDTHKLTTRLPNRDMHLGEPE